MKGGFGSVALDCAARLLVPFILMFGLYVIFHGHDSPGGGFQGGCIMAVAGILLQLVHGDHAGWRITPPRALILACVGVGIYSTIGVASMLFGGNYLDYAAFPLGLDAAKTRALCTFVIECGVGLAVMGVLLLIFQALLEPEPA